MNNLSKECRDKLLEEKMEAIRKRNEDIMRRHAEIEADKRNADIFSNNIAAIRKSKPPENRRPGERSPAVPNAPAGRGRRLQTLSEKIPKAKEVEEKMKRRLDIGNEQGPPPDPNFNFLLDHDRINLKEESSMRHKSNFGGADFENVMSAMQQQRNYEKEHPLDPPQSKLEMSLRMTGKERFQYEQWKEERKVIDAERIARQKTSQGTFRREWDMDKQVTSRDVPQKQESQFYRQPDWDDEPDESDKRRNSRRRGNERRSYRPGGRSRGGRGQGYRTRYSRQSSDDDNWDIEKSRSVVVGKDDALQVKIQNRRGSEDYEDVEKNRSVVRGKDDVLQVKIQNRTNDLPVQQNSTSEHKKPSPDKPMLLTIRPRVDLRRTESENEQWKGSKFSEKEDADYHSERGGFHRKTQVFTSRSRGSSQSDSTSYSADWLDEAYDTSKSQTFVSSSKKRSESHGDEKWGTPLQKGADEEVWGMPVDDIIVTVKDELQGRLDNVTETPMVNTSDKELPQPTECGAVGKDVDVWEDDDDNWEDVSDDEELEEVEPKCISHAQKPEIDSRGIETSIYRSEIVDAEELHQAHTNLDDSGIIVEHSYNQTQLDDSTLLLDETFDDDSLLGNDHTLEAAEKAVVPSSNPNDSVRGDANSNGKCFATESSLVCTANERTNPSTSRSDVDVIEGTSNVAGTMNNPNCPNVCDTELVHDDARLAKVQHLDNRQTEPGHTDSIECHDEHVTDLVQGDSSHAKVKRPVSEQTRPSATSSTECHDDDIHDKDLVQVYSSHAKVEQPDSEQTRPCETPFSVAQGTNHHQEKEVLKMSNVPLDSKERISAQSLDASKALITIDEASESEELADSKVGLQNRKPIDNRNHMVGMQIPEIVFSMVENQELDDD